MHARDDLPLHPLRSLMLAALLLAHGTGSAVQRPEEEMQGGCRDYRTSLVNEFAEWRKPPLSKDAARDAVDAARSTLTLRRKYAIALHPAAEVQLVVEPEEPVGEALGYAGLLAVTVPGMGNYRVSVGGPVSIEIVADGKALAPREYEMQTRCELIYKTVEYTLRAGVPYLLQIADSPADELSLLVTSSR